MAQELEQLQERGRQVDALILRKEAFVERLRIAVEDMEREHAAIRATEKQLRVPLCMKTAVKSKRSKPTLPA